MNVSQLISTAYDLQGACWRFILEKLCSNHEKTKTTFTIPGTVCEGGLRIYCGFHSCWCFYAFFFLFFFWCDNFVFIYLLIFFVQTSTNVFVGYTNAALMRFATIPKVHTIAHAKMDSREMDENVKVSVGFISDYAIKR